MPKSCSSVPSSVLLPEASWGDRAEFDAKLRSLGAQFASNFAKFTDSGVKYVGAETVRRMLQGGPQQL